MRLYAFTLIELLIVVAIIAILAAIAVPNFMEAQTRSKLSRVKADMRSVATALESYTIDYNKPPLGEYEIQQAGAGGDPSLASLPRYLVNEYALSRITTPVAYMSSVPPDPFKKNVGQTGGVGGTGLLAGKGPLYTYHSHTWKSGIMAASIAMGYTWSLHSLGPSARNADSGNVDRFLIGLGWDTELCPYDPTNGTRSYGQVFRTNKGDFQGAGS